MGAVTDLKDAIDRMRSVMERVERQPPDVGETATRLCSAYLSQRTAVSTFRHGSETDAELATAMSRFFVALAKGIHDGCRR